MNRNYYTTQTQKMTNSTCYGVAGFIEYYNVHRPGVSIDVKTISSDPLENHFGVVKWGCKGEVKVSKIRDAEARCSAFKLLTARQFVARGCVYETVRGRNRLLAEKVILKGNCLPNTDQGENEIKYINRTHAIKPINMNNTSNRISHNNANLYKDKNVFQNKK